jgi:hypothetical protein
MSTLVRFVAIVVLATLVVGCASTATPTPPRSVTLEGLHRVAVVPSGETRFAGVTSSKEPDRELDDVLKWLPYKELLVPIARAVYRGVSWLMNDRANAAPRDVTPGAVVADAFVRSLRVSGPFNEILALDKEPVGDARRNLDAIVRVTVPTWGLLSVRDGDAPQVAGFADVRAQLVARESGVVLWQHEEDVTHPDRLALSALKQDRTLSREELVEVLERAGRRLATELLYARGRAQ